MFFTGGGKFYEWYEPSVAGEEDQAGIGPDCSQEGRLEGRQREYLGPGSAQCYTCMMLMDYVTISRGGGEDRRHTYDIEHALIYSLRVTQMTSKQEKMGGGTKSRMIFGR